MKRVPLRRTGKLKPKKRTKSERERIYGPPGYVEWCHAQPCIACGVVGFSEVAHVGNGGMGRKSDWTDTVPLCGPRPALIGGLFMGCHRFYDEYPKQFWSAYELDMDAETQRCHSRWIEESKKQ